MEEYVDLVLKQAKKPLNIDKIYEKVLAELVCVGKDTLTASDKKAILTVLEDGVKNYKYYCTPKGTYVLFSKTSFKIGRFTKYDSANGEITTVSSCEDKNGDVHTDVKQYHVSIPDTVTLVDGDLVLIDTANPSFVRVLDRSLSVVTGEIVRRGNVFYLAPLDKKKHDLIIMLEGQQVEGEIVSVSLIKHQSTNYYIGSIIKHIGHKDDAKGDVLIEAIKSGMQEGFSEETLKQIESIPMSVSLEDTHGRYDFRDWNVFSIDGASSKDKDDCISYKRLPNGNTLLGVHIADYNHYVKEGTPLDKDAFRKGTSCYFAGRVEPMIPHKLSNGICSLNDGVDRLTNTVLIEYDNNGTVISRKIVKGVIRSTIGMTYEDVNKIFDGEGIPDKYKPHIDDLMKMRELSDTLSKRRMRNGSLEIDKTELCTCHDMDGNVVGVTHRCQGVAENIIEEFMLAANIGVSEILTEEGIPCIYRIHDLPDKDRLTNFLNMLEAIGIGFEYSADDVCNDKIFFQALINHVKQSELSDSLLSSLIKCMSHAKYSTNNIGHYGTGFEIYTHFTSPIRRLCDAIISRILDECYFETDEVKKRRNISKWKRKAQEAAIQATKMERVAERVERNVLQLELSKYMSNYIGQSFEGTVISISDNNIMVQLDNMVEGKISVAKLGADYVYSADNFALYSTNGSCNYYIGDKLSLKLVDADPSIKSIEFEVVKKIKESPYIEADKKKVKK